MVAHRGARLVINPELPHLLRFLNTRRSPSRPAALAAAAQVPPPRTATSDRDAARETMLIYAGRYSRERGLSPAASQPTGSVVVSEDEQ